MTRFTPPIIVLITLFLAGCGSQSALDLRSAEFAYTPEKLGQELSNRLKEASASRARSKADDARGADVRERESDRGGDGDRPDPNSVEAIVADAIVKIKNIQAAGTEDATDQVLKIVAAAPDISADIKSEFESGVKAGMAPQ